MVAGRFWHHPGRRTCSIEKRRLGIAWEELTAEKGAELKNARGSMRAKEVIADTTRRVLKDW